MAMSAPMKRVWVFVEAASSTVYAGMVVTAARETSLFSGAEPWLSPKALSETSEAEAMAAMGRRPQRRGDPGDGVLLEKGFIGAGRPVFAGAVPRDRCTT